MLLGMASESDGRLRWRLADEDHLDGQGALFDGDELVEHHVGTGEFRGMEFLHVNARTIINEVPASSRMPFRYTINAYRGCSHACIYCFARPTHEYLGLDVGEDFERKIVVKVNAVERLRAELAGRRWAGHHIAMGTNTDPYQRCEGKYHLTRGVVEVLSEAPNPFSILTKSTLILRDLSLLAAAARPEGGGFAQTPKFKTVRSVLAAPEGARMDFADVETLVPEMLKGIDSGLDILTAMKGA